MRSISLSEISPNLLFWLLPVFLVIFSLFRPLCGPSTWRPCWLALAPSHVISYMKSFSKGTSRMADSLVALALVMNVSTRSLLDFVRIVWKFNLDIRRTAMPIITTKIAISEPSRHITYRSTFRGIASSFINLIQLLNIYKCEGEKGRHSP